MKENMKEIEQLKENFETIHEKFNATDPCPLSVAIENFVRDLCLAFDINDFDLNYVAIKAYRNVCKVLDERLSVTPDGDTAQVIRHLSMLLHPFMEKFHIQAGRHYD